MRQAEEEQHPDEAVEEEEEATGEEEEQRKQWKEIVPVLYDWLTNHHLVWPSLSCRWGPVISQKKYKQKQRLYLSEQTDGSVPNTLLVCNVEVVRPRVAAAEHISKFKEKNLSPFVKKCKSIVHPGEVNRIRELPLDASIVATHTDSPEVLVWHMERQEGRAATSGAAPSIPDLVLEGHTKNAEFALSFCHVAPLVLSGGRDKMVLLWNLQDHVTSLQSSLPSSGAGQSESGKLEEGHKETKNEGAPASGQPPLASPTPSPSPPPSSAGTKVSARGKFRGHSATVEDVAFRRSSESEFCSVGDDGQLLLWDARAGEAAVGRVANAHGRMDVHCVDWNPSNEELLLTGSADTTVKMFDRRKLGNGSGSGGSSTGEEAAAVECFKGHSAAVMCVQWCPDRASVFASSADDGLVNVWDADKVTQTHSDARVVAPELGAVGPAEDVHEGGPPKGLIFQHVGHRDKVVEFHWDPSDPWTIASVSSGAKGGGGTLQVWRIMDLIYRPVEEVMLELRKHKDLLLSSSGP